MSAEDTVTGVFATKQHQAGSLAYLTNQPRRPRPTSAAVTRRPPTLPTGALPRKPRPQSAAVTRRPSAAYREAPAPPPPPPKPQGPKGTFPWDPEARLARPRTPAERKQAIDSFFSNLYERHKLDTSKTATQRMINGELGPCAPMEGVKRYPYTAGMRIYQDEFEAMVTSTITHPYVTTAVNNSESIPFDMLSGMAYDDARLSGFKVWTTETQRSYVPRSIHASKNAKAVGIRSECVQFIS